MPVASPEHSSAIRAALREIVSEYGPETLSRPATMSNLLKDLLPDAPRETRMLVAAAEDRIAETLREHVSQGMDAATAARLTASFFASATMFTPDVCAWVVGEFAIALGLIPELAGPPTVVAPWSERAAVGGVGFPGAAGVPRPAAGPTRRPEPAPVWPAGAAPAPHYRLSDLATRAAPDAYALATLTGTLYVVSESDGTVTPLDLATGTSGTAIRVPGLPRSIAISPDGSLACVACYSDGTIIPVSLGTASQTVVPRTPGAAIGVGNGPVAVVISPDGLTAYVACEEDGTIVPVDIASGTAGAPVTIGKRPYAIALAPDGATAYVASQGDGTLTPVSLPGSGPGREIGVSGTAGTPVRVGSGPVAVTLTPDGTAAYVANHADGTVTPIRLAPGAAVGPAVAQATAVLGPPIRVGRRPVAIAITPDGAAAYVANHGDDTVTPISLPTGAAGAPVKVGRRPYAIVIAPDGKTAFVANHGDGTVTPMSLPDGMPGAPIKVPRRPWAIAITR